MKRIGRPSDGKQKTAVTVSVLCEIMEEARKQNINISQSCEDGIKAALGRPSEEFLLFKKAEHENEIKNIESQLMRYKEEDKHKAEVARIADERRIEQAILIAKKADIMHKLKKELIEINTEKELKSILNQYIKENPDMYSELNNSLKTFQSIMQRGSWKYQVNQFKIDLGIKAEEEE